MANYTDVQILEDGPRNVVIKLTGILDTSDVTATELIDPADLAKIGVVEGVANRVRISKIVHNIEDGLAVYLYWEATSDVLILPLEGRGHPCYESALVNTEAAGVTGVIKYATQGWTVGATLSFALELTLIKSKK